MNKKRIFHLSLAWLGAFALILAIAMVFQVPAAHSQSMIDSDKSGMTLTADQANAKGMQLSGGSFPLFAGNDTTTIPQVQIDVSTGISTTAFIGVDAWGAAYDPVNNILYHSDGDELYSWQPGGGAPVLLGAVTDATGASVNLHGMAFYNGTLYATDFGDDQIYSVDVGTLVATTFINFTDSAASVSGIAIDPTNGDIYAVDDGGNDALVRVNPDGSFTVVGPYLGGETDVDGLAISPARMAYLITDDPTPDYFNVFDLNVMTYTNVISYPWGGNTTAQVSGAWIEQPGGIDLVKTVGLDINSCAPTNVISVTQFTQVTYCYEVTNNETYTLTYHDLVDSEIGTILNGFPFDLGPGASVFVTDTDFIFDTTVNTATWTACNVQINGQAPAEGFDCGSPSAIDIFSDTASATVNVLPPSIDMTKTVGTDPNACATTDAITVTQGTEVTYCYDVSNTGPYTLTVHDLSDDTLGTILTGFPFTLTPGASVFITQSANILVDTTNIATWTACNIDGPASLTCFDTAAFDVVSDTDSATVNILPPSISLSKTVGTDPNICASGSNITVQEGTDVTYCYDVTNTGGVTLTVHELDDSELGTILTGFPFTLTPGASVFLTQTANITTDTVNVATWTACNIDGPPTLTCFDSAAFDVVSDTATANVTVTSLPPQNPSIAMTKTVGLDNSVCATSNTLMVGQPSTEVYYCYTVQNTGDVTFTTHDLFDNKLGTILSSFPFVLGPGESTSVFPVTKTITTTVTNVATWTASVDMPTVGPIVAVASASATVTEQPTAVSLDSFSGGSNGFVLPVMFGVLALLVFAPILLIRRLKTNE